MRMSYVMKLAEKKAAIIKQANNKIFLGYKFGQRKIDITIGQQRKLIYFIMESMKLIKIT